MTNTEKFFVKCVKKSIKNEKITTLPNNVDFVNLYKLCCLHSMSVIVLAALEDVKDQLPPDFFNALQHLVHRHIMLDSQSEYDKNIFLSEMDKRGLKHMPLKGYHLKKLYPHTAMRYTSDCDVLIDISQLNHIRALVKELGLKTKRHDEHHDIVYFPTTKTVFELHKTIFVGPLQNHFNNIFDRAFLKEGTRALYEMSSEDFYISILGHSAYHFAESAGVGIRHLTDIYLYKNANKLDYEYLNKELERCGLLTFKDRFEKVSEYFFEDKNVDSETLELAEHILKSSLLANQEKKAAADVAVHLNEKEVVKSKNITFFRTFFPQKEHMQFSYPILKKYIWLLPFFYLIRWVHVLFTRPQNINKLIEYKKVDEADISHMKKLRKFLGIEHL